MFERLTADAGRRPPRRLSLSLRQNVSPSPSPAGGRRPTASARMVTHLFGSPNSPTSAQSLPGTRSRGHAPPGPLLRASHDVPVARRGSSPYPASVSTSIHWRRSAACIKGKVRRNQRGSLSARLGGASSNDAAAARLTRCTAPSRLCGGRLFVAQSTLTAPHKDVAAPESGVTQWSRTSQDQASLTCGASP